MTRFKVVRITRAHTVHEWATAQLEDACVDMQEHICLSRAELARHAGDADVVWAYGSGQAPDLLKGENLTELRRCGAIVCTASGVDHIDVAKATELGIIVVNTPQVFAESVSDHAIALLLSLLRQINRQDRLVRSGRWDPKQPWPGRVMTGATLGLVGFGHIPQRMVQRLVGFELNVLVFDPYAEPALIEHYGARAVPLDELLRRSDFVSLHCPLTDETHHLIGERELRLMKSDSLLINTARGAVVDEVALIRALQEGWIAGAALDVLEQEPPDVDNPLFELENVILTPHSAGYDASFPQGLLEASVTAIIDLSQRRWPYSVVNPKVKPRWRDMPPR